ncbi:hypothetical protein SAMN02745900_05402 [Pseudomonas sp. URIL14HWK12:I8]|nr:hypothetical protein SAMN02745900_05402 [Pseudomonas sp. URIL14HWK12:I8]
MQQKQAAPLALLHLEKAVAHLECEAAQARAAGNMAALLKSTRDIALLTIGFWRGFRGDELARLTIENTHAERYVGNKFYLGSSKGDQQNIGREYKTPSLSKLCPVEAYLNWVSACCAWPWSCSLVALEVGAHAERHIIAVTAGAVIAVEVIGIGQAGPVLAGQADVHAQADRARAFVEGRAVRR